MISETLFVTRLRPLAFSRPHDGPLAEAVSEHASHRALLLEQPHVRNVLAANQRLEARGLLP